jgi:lipid-A-disaccharide synthase
MAIPHIYLISGEPSGDIIGAHLINSIKSKTKDKCMISGVGGTEMEKLGFKSLFPMSEITVMGLAEVIPSLPNLFMRIRQTIADIKKKNPCIVVTIDAPDFSFRILKKISKSEIPLVHYVAPSVWAWKPGRAKKIAQFLNKLLTLFPFEPPYFEKEGLSTVFVGHPVVESKAGMGEGVTFRKRYKIPKSAKVLSVLPGSRVSEIKRLLPIIMNAINCIDRKNLYINLPTLDNLVVHINDLLKHWDIPVIVTTTIEEKYAGLAASDVAIAASGTVSLELAMAGVPNISIYKFNPITAFIGRRLVKTKFANLVNILLDKEVVPELIQEKCNSDLIYREIKMLLDNKEISELQLKNFDIAIKQLTNNSERPSDKAANIILETIKSYESK